MPEGSPAYGDWPAARRHLFASVIPGPATRGTRRSVAWHGPCCGRAGLTCSSRSSPNRCRTACRRRPSRSHALRLPDHELDGRHVDRGAGPDRLRAGRDAEDDAGSGRRPELSGVARREPLRAAREHHRHHLVERTFWFFGTVFIFILAANWIGLFPGVGTIGWGHDGRTASRWSSRSSAAPTRIST